MKYIVYCTTNLVNNKIYIGVHQTNDELKFDGYIGNGVNINMPSTYNYPKYSFQYAVKKYGIKNFKRSIISVFDNAEDAFYLEEQIVNVDFIKRTDVYNEVIGGHGGDIAQNAKPCFQYDLEGNFIKEYKSQQQASIEVNRSFTVIKRAIRDKIKAANYFWTDIKYDKLDLSLYKTENDKIPVFQYSNTGEYDCCYECISDAARVINSTTSNLYRAIKLGYLYFNKYYSYEFYPRYDRAKTESIKGRPVYQYSVTGEYIAEYSNEAEAQRELGIKKLNISHAIKLNRTSGGFQWSLEKLPYLPNISKKYSRGKARKVGQYTKTGELIKIYNTVSSCKKDFPSCQGNLKGKTKSSGGFIFKYID